MKYFKKALIIILICLVIVLSILLIKSNKMKNENYQEFFVIISEFENTKIVYDIRTKIQYAISKNGEMTVLLNYNGSPLIYNK